LNTATGFFSLTNNSGGVYNKAMGRTALRAYISGSLNTAIRNRALSLNKTGDNRFSLLPSIERGLSDGEISFSRR
jgi:hypothetical protein